MRERINLLIKKIVKGTIVQFFRIVFQYNLSNFHLSYCRYRIVGKCILNKIILTW